MTRTKYKLSIIEKEDNKWVLYASAIDGSTIQMKTFNDNCKCGLSFNNKNVTSTWWANTYANRFKQEPNWGYSTFKKTKQTNFVVNVSNWQYTKLELV